MTAKRTPVHRPPVTQMTPEAIKIFNAMRTIVCTCEPRDWNNPQTWGREPCDSCRRWWDLHDLLHHELHCKPWQFPCIEHPHACSPYPPGSVADRNWQPDRAAQDLWRALDEASREARREARRRKTGEKLGVEPSGAAS